MVNLIYEVVVFIQTHFIVQRHRMFRIVFYVRKSSSTLEKCCVINYKYYGEEIGLLEKNSPSHLDAQNFS